MLFSEKQARRHRVRGVEVTVLGSVAISDGGSPLALGGPKQRAVLAMLVADVGRLVSAEALVQGVYGEDAPDRRRRTISTYISALRAELGVETIAKKGSGWVFVGDPASIDAVRFEQLVASARESTPEAAAGTLREALVLWQGRPYAEVEAHGQLDAEIDRLDELRLRALEARIEADLALGRHGDLVAEIAALMAEHPYREHLRAQHMLALYRAGRQREALASYQEMHTLLVEELGADPTPELQALEGRIITQDPALDLPTPRAVQRRAVLVADLGDPLDRAGGSPARRDQRLTRMIEVLQTVTGRDDGGEAHLAGAACYLVLESAPAAVAAALAAADQLDGTQVRIAIDWGDIEVGDGGISGPPVSRSAALVSAAHPGQVLISAEAHDAVIHGEDSVGVRFESLGSHRLPGIESPIQVLQLLIGDPPHGFDGLDPTQLPPPLPSGRHRSVPGYELRELLGEGSVGSLYRAYQPSVGREVIVEVIERSVASDPDFIRHFEADAQRLALLDHPHIDPLLDYWREPDGAYLVYRNRRGGLLRSAADAPPRLLEQIGSALAYVHSYGIVHGSVRPDRILLDESGFGYLIGFPVGNRAPRSSAEHAAYIAPETLVGGAPGVAGDIYALAVFAHEIESGPVDGDRPLAPDDGALARALSEDPSSRHGSVGEFMTQLMPAAVDPATRFTEVRNPYKGLAAFHESDAADFFGRSELTATLSARLTESGFVAVVGPSGVGKSSVVRAGLVPAVRRGAIEGSAAWVITDMLPGTHPFLELRRALERVAVDLPPALVEGLVERQANALDELSTGLPEGAEAMLVIDQFEELFTLCEESVARRFMDLLASVVESQRARVVVTMRADFLDRPLLYSTFGELLGENLVTVASPNRDELAQAVVGPAESVGVAVDAGLVERICSEVHDRPGALPLLQHALVELFSTRTTDTLTLDGYEAIGGVAGALERRAEATFAALDDRLRPIAHTTMLRLVTVIDDGAPTRRRVRVDRLDDPEADIVEAFVRARLLVNDIDPDTRNPTVEVAHETLLTRWPRLNGWIESHRGELGLHARLCEAAAEWEAAGRASAHLLTGGRLAQHETWVQTSDLALADTERELLSASRSEANARASRQRRRRTMIMTGFGAAAVVAVVLAIVAIAAGRRANDRRAAAEVAEAAAVTEANRADVNAAEAEASAARADDARADAQASAEVAASNARLARARELAASAINVLDVDPELATLLTLEAISSTPGGREQPVEVVNALWSAVQQDRLIDVVDTGYDDGVYVVLSPDDTTLYAVIGFPAGGFPEVLAVQAYSSEDRTLLWEHRGAVATFEELDEMVEPRGDIYNRWLHVSPDGRRLALDIVGAPSRFEVFDAGDGTIIQTVEFSGCDALEHPQPWLSGWSQDGTLFAAVGVCPRVGVEPGNRWVEFFDGVTFASLGLTELPPAQSAQFPQFDDAGRLFVFGDDLPVIVVDGFEDSSITVLEGVVGAGDVSPDGSTLITLSVPAECRLQAEVLGQAACGGLTVSDAATGERADILPLDAVPNRTGMPTLFSGHDRLVAVPTEGADVVVFDLRTGEQRYAVSAGPALNAALTSDAQRLFTGHLSGTFQIWDLGANVGLDPAGIIPAGFAVSANSAVAGETLSAIELIDVATTETRVQFFDQGTGEFVGEPVDGSRPIIALAGDRFMVRASGGPATSAYPWLILDPRAGTQAPFAGCELDPDQRRCIDGSNPYGFIWTSSQGGAELLRQGDGSFTLIDPDTVAAVGELEPSTPFDFIAAFSDEYLGGSADSALVIEDRRTGDELAFSETAGNRFEIAPDGSVIAFDLSDRVMIVGTDTWEIWQFPIDLGRIAAIAADATTRRLALGDENGIHIFDIDTGTRLRSIPVPNTTEIHWLDSTRLAVGTDRGAWATLSLDDDALIRFAVDRLTRTFSPDECTRYRIDPCPALAELRNRN